MSKEKLAELQETNQYVFHGSPDGTIEVLEPRQSTHLPDASKPAESIPDGKPAISATPYADLAIFRAIVNKNNIPLKEFSSGFGIDNNEKRTFQVSSKEVLEHTKDKKGYVYVFYRSKFEPYGRDDRPRPAYMEWRAYEPVAPVEVLEVTDADLPEKEKIKIGVKD
jgi:hypothetical protein